MEDYITRIAEKVQVLVGAEVNYVRFSYQLDLHFISAEQPWTYTNIQIEKARLLIAGASSELDPEHLQTSQIVPLVGLTHQKLAAATLHDANTLVLTFANDTAIILDPSLVDKVWQLG